MSNKVKKTLKDSLNSQQYDAVTTVNGPVAVFAGAGSGKTRVITYRIANLLNEGIPITNILAVTFTNKAANEMKERIQGVVEIDPKKLWIGTFHSICLRILRQSGKAISLRPDFTVFDEEDSLSLIKDCMKESNIDIKRVNPRTVSKTISDSKVALVSSEDYPNVAGTGYFVDIVSSVYALYEKRLRENNALDFDDLIYKTVILFQNEPSTLDQYQEIFKHILVDEYQDVNAVQYELLRLLANKHRNIFVVGDDDQSIYAFRGADPTYMLRFRQEYPDAKVIKLEENYRCSQMILNAAHCVVQNNEKREEKKLWTNNEKGTPVKLVVCSNEKDEAQKTIQLIQERIKTQNRTYNDFVVLYRINAASRNFEEALMADDIPYQLVGGYRFYQRKEVKDFIAYLRIVNNPDDRVSINRVINYPKRNIGAVFIRKIEKMAHEDQCSFYDACHHLLKKKEAVARGRKGLQEFIDVVEAGRKLLQKGSLLDVAKLVYERTNIPTMLETEYAEDIAKDKVSNLRELLSAIHDFEQQYDGTEPILQAFLAQVSLFTDLDNMDPEQSRVTLMTIHSVKGLEFPIVFMAGMEEGLFPHYLSNCKQNALEEERRLCYVGFTRAKTELYLSYAMNRELYGKTTKSTPSRFLEEISEDLIERLKISTPRDGETGLKRKVSSVNRSKKDYSKGNPVSLGDLTAGKIVCHKIWGHGIVLDLKEIDSEHIIHIDFDTVGERMLNFKYAPLRIVEEVPTAAKGKS
ncbi:MAG: UvrD-helicase domain-containing protein [Caldisericia bacterium]|nr:UvrD-helicase domain-containing protein [Caldisericia bacterium]MDD4615208.1 UvrD-helicase domain-containing protein [Caldisericia bacterium]